MGSVPLLVTSFDKNVVTSFTTGFLFSLMDASVRLHARSSFWLAYDEKEMKKIACWFKKIGDDTVDSPLRRATVTSTVCSRAEHKVCKKSLGSVQKIRHAKIEIFIPHPSIPSR